MIDSMCQNTLNCGQSIK
uniref:Uncharacterized protein n=1 Tax=Arundo donax TaxID=35708 RepID=A0A0A9BDJ4_ARUDO